MYFQNKKENSESHVDDEDGKERMRKTEAAMLKRHAEQRLAVAQGDKIELHQELDQVGNMPERGGRGGGVLSLKNARGIHLID